MRKPNKLKNVIKPQLPKQKAMMKFYFQSLRYLRPQAVQTFPAVDAGPRHAILAG